VAALSDDRIRIRKLSPEEVKRDIDIMLWSFKLQGIRRWVGQPYWDEESAAAKYSDKLEGFPRLETVAEHSWNVADSVILLAPNFPYINRAHAVELAIMHDKMEIRVGDWNPLGKDGTGNRGHAFNQSRQATKHEKELDAIALYVRRLRPEVARLHRSLLLEGIECRTPEARLVKAIDKMQALAFILWKKGGTVADKHLGFLIRFTEKNDRYFPPLRAHSQELLSRIFEAAAKHRKMTKKALWRELNDVSLYMGAEQLPLVVVDGLDELVDDTCDPSPAGSKLVRLRKAFEELAGRPPAHTGIEAYRQLSDAINRVEDQQWGSDYWDPPRHLPPDASTKRLYPIAPECMYPVPGFAGVDVLVAKDHVVFISRYGAIEAQEKDRDDLLGDLSPFASRRDKVIFEKPDSEGSGVWDGKNCG